MNHGKEPEAVKRGDDETDMSEGEIDLNLVQTFPASDPPSWTLGTDHGAENPGKQSGGEKEPDEEP